MYPIIIPESVVPRWHQALENDRLIEWRSLAFWLSAEAKLAQVYGQHEIESDLLTLFEVAMQFVYGMTPQRVEELA
jgi:hypothetical protein